jgi:hypothetical protein
MVLHVMIEVGEFLPGGKVKVVAAVEGGDVGGRRRGEGDALGINPVTYSRHEAQKKDHEKGRDEATAAEATDAFFLWRRGRRSG